MRKIIAQEWVSADGFATDRNGSTEFFEDPKYNEGFTQYQEELFDRIDGVLLGATTYKMFSEYWPAANPEQEPITPLINKLHKIVFSKTIDHPSWQPATIRRDDVASAVRELKNEDGKALVIWGSLSLVERLAHENLVDEYWIIVVPVFVGKGKKFIPEDKDIELELFESKIAPSGAVFLKYKPKQSFTIGGLGHK